MVGIVPLTTWDLIDPGLADHPVDDFTQPAHYVCAHQTIDELLPVLRPREDHMAIVVDERGGIGSHRPQAACRAGRRGCEGDDIDG